MEIGLCTFVETRPDASDRGPRAAQRVKDLLEEIELADQLGLEVFAIGEHHRADYVASAPAVLLAAAAARTKRIRLSSAVTVLSSDDPVRVFQAFATLDLISQGRAEIMAGRGSFIESYPLFGYDLEDYDELFTEKLELLLKLRESERVTWSGKHRAPINDLPVYPRPLQQPLPVWIAVGGTPASVVRAATLNLPLTLAIIGGEPERFAPLIQLYRQSSKRAGFAVAPPVCINSHAWVAEDSKQAADEFYPSYAEVMTRIGRERGWPPTNREHFEAMRGPRGALLVGSPQQVIDKLLFEHELFGYQRYLLQLSVGVMPHERMLKAIELIGTVVAPAVRKALAP
jgi:probable LLM family oxidoreductase